MRWGLEVFTVSTKHSRVSDAVNHAVAPSTSERASGDQRPYCIKFPDQLPLTSARARANKSYIGLPGPAGETTLLLEVRVSEMPSSSNGGPGRAPIPSGGSHKNQRLFREGQGQTDNGQTQTDAGRQTQTNTDRQTQAASDVSSPCQRQSPHRCVSEAGAGVGAPPLPPSVFRCMTPLGHMASEEYS